MTTGLTGRAISVSAAPILPGARRRPKVKRASAGGHGGTTVNTPVRTYQVAPTILADLGLNPQKLDSVRLEHVQVLPVG
jgi:hypothetical protein